jgi:hypothetical protein
LVPHFIAIILFYIITIGYFSPVFMDNMELRQGDMTSVEGMTKEVTDYHEKTGEYSGWMNSMFSGMPTETLYGDPGFNIFHKITSIFRGFLDYNHAGILFTYLICFYIFMLCIGASPWLSILGALAFSLASYNLIIIEAGHVTKGYAMAYVAPIIGGVILTFRKKYFQGGLITLLFLGMEIASSHLQITYYAMITVGVLGICYFIYYLKQKELVTFGKAAGILIIVAGLSVLPNLGNLLPTYEYSKDTMRGGSELTIVPDNKKEDALKPHDAGLEIDYAYSWSYGKMETFTLLVPDMYGGGHTILDKSDDTFQQLKSKGYSSTYLPTYWGDQPFTSGPVYAGAIIVFLFILGLFAVKGPEKWFVIGVTLISFILAWGKNFEAINNFLFYNLPFYNKFRTPSMALTIAGVAMPILGMLALKNIFTGEISKEKAWKYTWISAAITGGLCLLIIAFGLFASLTGTGDKGYMDQLLGAGFDQDRIDAIMNILKDYRKSMLMGDGFRSLVFVGLAFATLWLFLKNKLQNINYIIAALAVLVLVDMWGVDRRYLNVDNFQPIKKVKSQHKATPADEMILQDKDINFRVINLASNTFNESNTSYYHKSIGGYSPAKLRRYQDIIDFYLSPELLMPKVGAKLMAEQKGDSIPDPKELNILNMLNTKYYVVPVGEGQTYPFLNKDAFGNAWFVKSVKFVDNPDQEILALKDAPLKEVAIVDVKFKDQIKNRIFNIDSTSTIKNTLCVPNRLEYAVKTSSEQLVVFSEVFYDKGGWRAYLDGKEVPHFRANYILRAMIIPAGDHKIEFVYTPYAREKANKVAAGSSILIILIFAGTLGVWIFKRRKTTPTL